MAKRLARGLSQRCLCRLQSCISRVKPAILTPQTDQATRVLPNKMDVVNPVSAGRSTWCAPNNRMTERKYTRLLFTWAQRITCAVRTVASSHPHSLTHTHTHTHVNLPIPHCDLKQTRVQMYTDAHTFTILVFRSVSYSQIGW